ncbi:hypothetical protein T11_5321 [Trichinella zimbabwensis]|uniref:Uncharacterized protein n=1 Tax=Trichinella zimbabwensis TaxID=268475 RepID=A0A0V1H1R7_9BILA|nr:hypothetical protein T11_5321 [Trichinella zimbabwensis]
MTKAANNLLINCSTKQPTVVRKVKAICNVVNVFNFVTPTRSWLHYCLATSVFRGPIRKFYVIDVSGTQVHYREDTSSNGSCNLKIEENKFIENVCCVYIGQKEILKRYEAPLYENSMDGSLIAPVIRGGVQISVLESSRHELQITQDSKRNLRIRMVL